MMMRQRQQPLLMALLAWLSGSFVCGSSDPLLAHPQQLPETQVRRRRLGENNAQQLEQASLNILLNQQYSHRELRAAGATTTNSIAPPPPPQGPLDIVSGAFRAAVPPPPKGTPLVATNCVKHLKGASKKKKGSKGPPTPRLCHSGSGSTDVSQPLPPPPPPNDDNPGTGGGGDDPGVDDDSANGGGGGGLPVDTQAPDGRTDDGDGPVIVPDDDDDTAIGDDSLEGGRGEPTPLPANSATLAPSTAIPMPTATSFTLAPVAAPVVVDVTSPTAPPALGETTSTPVASPRAPTASPTAPPPTTSPTAAPLTCQDVADETFTSNQAAGIEESTYDLQLGLAISSTASVEQVLDELRSALQTSIAPSLTNCSATSTGRFLQQQDASPATIVNVVFGKLEVDEFNDCSDFGIASDGETICVTTASLATAYHDSGGSMNGFSSALETAIMSTNLNVEGNDIVSALVTESATGTPSVPEGGGGESTAPDDDVAGDDDKDQGNGGGATNDDDGTSGIEGPSNVDPGSGGISAGAAVGVTAGILLVVLASMFVVRRRHRQYREDNSLLKPSHTDDEEDDMMHSGSSYSTSPQRRLAHVVGEDDSIFTSADNYSLKDGIEVEPVYAPSSMLNHRNLLDSTFDEDYMNEDENIEVDSQDNIHPSGDHHWCSSPHCESCEMKRQNGVTFIPTSPRHSADSSMIPREARRDYDLHDTVEL